MARTPARVPEKTIEDISLLAEAERVFQEDIPKGIHAKMAHIMATMPAFKPEGKNQHFRYAYWSTDQITGYFRRRFGELAISFGVSVESYDIREAIRITEKNNERKETTSFLTTLLCRFTLTDTDTGEVYSDVGIGQGDDPGDKGSNKALAGATKYWLLKVFLMGGEDAEADASTDERASGRRRSRRETSNVVIEDSNIEGIARGGRSSKATEAQVKQVRVLAAELAWDAPGTARRIGEWLGDELELPEEAEERGPALVRYLDGLSSEDIGKVIREMVELRDAPEEAEDERDIGVSDYP